MKNDNQVFPGLKGHTYVGELATKLAYKTEAEYCIQCADKISGKVGCFIHFGDLRAATEIFADLHELFKHMAEIGWKHKPGSILTCIKI